MITVNIHPIERIARLIVGLFVLSLIAWGPKSLWGFVGFGPILTGASGWCPLYSLLGVNTCGKKAS
jgi:hypothetical protein